jgi:hypothetical protein
VDITLLTVTKYYLSQPTPLDDLKERNEYPWETEDDEECKKRKRK